LRFVRKFCKVATFDAKSDQVWQAVKCASRSRERTRERKSERVRARAKEQARESEIMHCSFLRVRLAVNAVEFYDEFDSS